METGIKAGDVVVTPVNDVESILPPSAEQWQPPPPVVDGPTGLEHLERPMAGPVYVQQVYVQPTVSSGPSPGIAMVINVFFPGLGQLYQERVLAAVVFFFCTAFGYFCFIVPGVIMHIIAILEAGSHRRFVPLSPAPPAPSPFSPRNQTIANPIRQTDALVDGGEHFDARPIGVKPLARSSDRLYRARLNRQANERIFLIVSAVAATLLAIVAFYVVSR